MEIVDLDDVFVMAFHGAGFSQTSPGRARMAA
jgi:hypothetical protein